MESMDDDFAREMQALADSAEKQKPTGSAKPRSDSGGSHAGGSPAIALAIEAVSRGVAEGNRLLNKIVSDLEKAPAAPVVIAAPESEAEAARLALAVETMTAQMQRQSQVDSANQRVFDAMHAELKSYKDGFMFDAMHKPFVRDLIVLSDDLGVAQRQAQARYDALPIGAGSEREFLRKLLSNLENSLAHFFEVFVRLEVEAFDTEPGAPLDRARHRTVSVEQAPSADHDATIGRSLKRGFVWRGRIIRAEDVIALRWKAPPATTPTVEEEPEAVTPEADSSGR